MRPHPLPLPGLAVSADWHAQQRAEWRRARDTSTHLPHPADCTCGCRYTPGDER